MKIIVVAITYERQLFDNLSVKSMLCANTKIYLRPKVVFILGHVKACVIIIISQSCLKGVKIAHQIYSVKFVSKM